ncbi:PH domain-containing protein [Nocardioides flavescens]|uniref:PH domain-containing protein n=1 Tax=Nocardioides flavescens TaxID=2691959 RepID=A0A6L7F268_9ACTN|nr:PH domain-containing protein [Nocardioides flavescens]MXG90742.1 PH domain-containing protein [Nocardioides flavescens]
MPAASEGGAAPALPRTWRPLGPRIVGLAVTLMLIAVVAVGWFSFDDETRSRFTTLQRGTLTFFGLLYLALMFGLLRSRAVAYADRLVVVNGFRRREFSWPQIVAARLPPGAPWVTLDLADGETCSVMGIQASDGARARRALADLRRLVDGAHPAG